MPEIRQMLITDLNAVLEIEEISYPVPWTRGIFEDCLRINYPSWVLVLKGQVIGYILFSIGADEAHLLNICIAPKYRQKGYAKNLLLSRTDLLKAKNIHSIFLEVRVSSKSAIALYKSLDYQKLGVRKNYYKTLEGREDALTFKLNL